MDMFLRTIRLDILTSEVQVGYKYVNLKNPRQEGASYLEYPWNLFCLSSVHISLCDWSDMKQFAAQDGTKIYNTYQKAYM